MFLSPLLSRCGEVIVPAWLWQISAVTVLRRLLGQNLARSSERGVDVGTGSASGLLKRGRFNTSP